MEEDVEIGFLLVDLDIENNDRFSDGLLLLCLNDYGFNSRSSIFFAVVTKQIISLLLIILLTLIFLSFLLLALGTFLTLLSSRLISTLLATPESFMSFLR